VIAALPTHFIKGLIVSNTSDKALTELRIARAYVKLSCIPEDRSGAWVSLTSIGDFDIRMSRGPDADFDGMPLFWLELFDHSKKTSVDGFSFSCYSIKEAAVIFDEFTLQAGRLNQMRGGCCG
jgi:hypothetical protein